MHPCSLSASPTPARKSLRKTILCATIATIATVASFPSLNAAAQSADPAFTTNPKYVAAMAEAKEMLHHRQISFAADAYKKANKIAEGKDPVCLEGLYDAQSRLGSYKDAVKTAEALETIATIPAARSKANLERGTALYRQAGDKAKPELLEAADAALKASLVDDPKSPQALYMDGYVLARLNHMDAAKQAFTQCLSCMPPRDPSRIRVQHLQENPTLATAKMAPPFTVVALDGSKFTLDAMTGRVVLIDFWATWCGPCNEELPHMKKIAKDFAGEPLVIISVSWDADEAKWKQFIAKNEYDLGPVPRRRPRAQPPLRRQRHPALLHHRLRRRPHRRDARLRLRR